MNINWIGGLEPWERYRNSRLPMKEMECVSQKAIK
jgi:hypothetical protein